MWSMITPVRRRLTNDDWGLESNCFVCEAKNPDGLRLEVYADDERGIVEAHVELGDAYSGAPTLVHGGISLAVLDEVQAWAVIALEHQWAVTVEMSARFPEPVWIGHPYRAVGEVTTIDGDVLQTVGRLIDAKERVCVESTSTFKSIGEATAVSLIGGDLPEEHRGYLRDE